jgi:hypothetical protein
MLHPKAPVMDDISNYLMADTNNYLMSDSEKRQLAIMDLPQQTPTSHFSYTQRIHSTRREILGWIHIKDPKHTHGVAPKYSCFLVA